MTLTRAKSRAVFIDRDGTIMHDADFCPDPPGQPSKCRKPAPGMVLEAARDHDVDLGHSFLIGDKEIDAECAHNAGVRAIRVRTGFAKMTGDSCADWVAEDLPAAAEIILKATK